MDAPRLSSVSIGAHAGEREMDFCDNAFCPGTIDQANLVAWAGRKFCSPACMESWEHQNSVLLDAAEPFHAFAREYQRNARAKDTHTGRR